MHSALRFGVRGYPTLKFFHNGQQFSYKGKRTKEALVNFATVRGASSARAAQAADPPACAHHRLVSAKLRARP